VVPGEAASNATTARLVAKIGELLWIEAYHSRDHLPKESRSFMCVEIWSDWFLRFDQSKRDEPK